MLSESEIALDFLKGTEFPEILNAISEAGGKPKISSDLTLKTVVIKIKFFVRS